MYCKYGENGIKSTVVPWICCTEFSLFFGVLAQPGEREPSGSDTRNKRMESECSSIPVVKCIP